MWPLIWSQLCIGLYTTYSSHFFHYAGLQKGLPSVKKYNAMAKAFEPIKAAGQKGDSSKAKDAYKKVKTC